MMAEAAYLFPISHLVEVFFPFILSISLLSLCSLSALTLLSLCSLTLLSLSALTLLALCSHVSILSPPVSSLCFRSRLQITVFLSFLSLSIPNSHHSLFSSLFATIPFPPRKISRQVVFLSPRWQESRTTAFWRWPISSEMRAISTTSLETGRWIASTEPWLGC